MSLSIRRRAVRLLALSSLIGFGMVTTAAAAVTPDNKCEAAKLRETGKLASCVMTSLSKTAKLGLDPDQPALDACDVKFTGKLDAAEGKAGGACPTEGDAGALADAVSALAHTVFQSVSGVRFVDNGDGTVTDIEQGVLWQKQTAGTGSPSSVDEIHTACDILAHLGTINGDATAEGLGGRNDWSLPTLAQLQSILDCSSLPCSFVDPILGPNPTPAVGGQTYLMSGETGMLPLSTLPCLKLVVMEDGSVDCKDLPSTEGRSKVRTNNNAR